MKSCWACRRRRLVCDGRVPHCEKCEKNGVECPGYDHKPLTWVGGVASRGQMRNRTFGETPPKSGPQMPRRLAPRTSPADAPSTMTQWGYLITVAPVPMPTDPILHGLKYEERYFVDYFSSRICPTLVLLDSTRNPYRAMLSLLGSSGAVLNAIMAVSICHFAHSTTGYPIFSSQNTTALLNPELLNHFITLKHNALRHLSQSIANLQDQRAEYPVLAAVILLVFLEAFESGANSWTIHLEGAKRIVEVGRRNDRSTPSTTLADLINELALFDALGSSLIRPGLLRSRLLTTDEIADSDLTTIGCPTELLYAIHTVASQRHTGAQPDIQLLHNTLTQIRHFDAQKWTDNVVGTSPEPSSICPRGMAQVCNVWKTAAEIYVSRIICQIMKIPAARNPLVDDLIAGIRWLETDDRLVKGLVWPAFIAGAESILPEHRELVLRILDRVWGITLIATARYAAMVLMNLWQKRDAMRELTGQSGLENWDWIDELCSLDHHWLFL
ncbi:Zn(II)2Cys6 transcription factor [Aspergillus alliaceus]|uniref:Zn(II)2Cys6 transcription factor n=1 Tax=Petromyces alliaceus TaxID=209559 RepID=UPI0012A5FE74|nr:fungal-specific transcription factor domain-containing protein [Aspergillus alliaceus]KAB8238016.1 fungal-specific transcription factor domain-containing protein [Aspergillus alliaceus]